MYLADVGRRALVPRRSLRRVAVPNLLALGTVSLLTDVSSEMVVAVLPAYLVLGLHLSMTAYGALDGLYTGATSATRLLGGYLADRFSRRKVVALVGYGLSAVSKLGLLATIGTPGAIGAVLAVDRTGKGVRTAPRDAMIAASVDEDDLGQAFGLHRMMDSVGAFLGPLAALGVLALAAGAAYDSVFLASACVAVLGVAVLLLFVREPGRAVVGPSEPQRQWLRPLLRLAGFRRLCVVAVLLGLATVGDGFVYLVLATRDDLGAVAFPLLAVGTSLAFLLLALPFGRLADRVGRWPVVVGGYLCLLLVYVLLASGRGPVPLVLALYGAFYAATDGVLAALAVPLLPLASRTTGLALLQTGQALAYVVSSVGFGLLWQRADVTTACLAAATMAAVLIAGCVGLLRSRA